MRWPCVTRHRHTLLSIPIRIKTKMTDSPWKVIASFGFIYLFLSTKGSTVIKGQLCCMIALFSSCLPSISLSWLNEFFFFFFARAK